MLSDAAESNLRIVEVEIGVTYDVEGSTKHPLSHGASVLYRIIRDMELKRPLYYFTLPGVIIVVTGAILTLIFLRDYLLGKSIHMGPTILAIMLTLFGTFFMFTGIILDSMKKMIEHFQK